MAKDTKMAARGIKLALLRKDVHEFAKSKWNSILAKESTTTQSHEEVSEVCSQIITVYEDQVTLSGLNVYEFNFMIPTDILDSMVYEDDNICCKSLYQLKVHFDLIDEVGLSDKTKVQDCPWSVMKEFVMKTKNYKSHVWYAATSEEEKVLVDRLIAAQSEQGDMAELVVRAKSTSYEYTDLPYRNKLFASEPIIINSDKNSVVNPET